MSKIVKFCLKQYEVPGLGASLDAVFTSLPILSIINAFSVLVILYETMNPYRIAYAPWIDFKTFIGILALLGVVCLILVYKFVLRSLWAFRSRQMQILEKLVERIEKLEKGNKNA